MKWIDVEEINFIKNWQKLQIQMWWRTKNMDIIENENTKLWCKLRRNER